MDLMTLGKTRYQAREQFDIKVKFFEKILNFILTKLVNSGKIII